MSQPEISQHKSFRWIIPNFIRENTEGCESGYMKESENIVLMFKGVRTVWNLMVYPNGDTHESEGCLSMYLTLVSAPHEIKVRYRLDLVKTTGENHFNYRGEVKSFKNQTSWGNSALISHKTLFAKQTNLLTGNRLTISCEIILYNESRHALKRPIIEVDKEMQKMFEFEIETDFELRFSDGKALKAHKFILIARSPVFYKMLTTNMEESANNFVVIPDFSLKVMKELLRFVYSGEVRDLDEIATDLIFAAEKYQIAKIKKICGDHIALNLSTDKEQVLDALIIADRISGLDNLIKKCVGIIVKDYKEFTISQKWNQLSKEIAFKILDEVMNKRCDVVHI